MDKKDITIIDNFFDNPAEVRQALLGEPMIDYVASDGVSYPGIIIPPKLVEEAVRKKIPMADDSLVFARISSQDMEPPNWAHSDFNMTDYVALVYLSPVSIPGDGTHFVKHKRLGFEVHPVNQEELDALVNESNLKSNWDVTFTCQAQFNRCFLFHGKYLHAAATQYGRDKNDSRLVLTAFIKQK